MAASASIPVLAAGASSSATSAVESASMFVCMHEITSIGFDFRTAMEGYARAGVKAVEPDMGKVREFEETNGAGSAKRLLDDLDLRAVSSSNQLFLDEPGPLRLQAVEDLKWKVELVESIGADRLVIPSAANQAHTMADYDQVYENLLEAAEIAKPYNIALMVEFTNRSTLISTLRTALSVVRGIDHPNLKVMIDVYHFWTGMSKFEDLDEIRQGEIHHLHFEDTPATPTFEVFERKDRVYPGEGIAPLQRILDKIRSKGYEGPASLELFEPEVQNTDPYEVAMKAIRTLTPYFI